MPRGKKRKILFAFGTRPEAIKLAPVISAARESRAFETAVCLTAQHREMVDQVVRLFDIKTDFDLNIMEKGQSLTDLTHNLLPRVREVIQEVSPACLVVQGDTTTAFAVALQAFYQKVPVAHVEAGLRSHDKYQPYPEEMNRVLISHLCDYHFAPTRESQKNLLREGVPLPRIFMTGNTVVDALIHIRKRIRAKGGGRLEKAVEGKRVILVTAHRRENFGKPLESICHALKKLAWSYPGTEIVYPVHLNPRVQQVVNQELRGVKGITLLPPLSYEEFVFLMDTCYLIITDSGGIQEEAPSFGKPVLVMREVSERPDGIALGVAKLVGTSERKIYREAGRLLKDAQAYRSMIKNKNPYGDGRASERIVRVLSREID